MFYNLLVAIVTVLIACYFYVKKKYSYWSDRNIQFIKPTFPFGNMKAKGEAQHMSQRMAKYYQEGKGNDPFVGIYFMLSPVVLVTDLKFVQNILIKDFQHFQERGTYYNEKDNPLSVHLVNLEHAKWKRLRSKLTPTFTSGKMKFMYPTIVAVGNELQQCLSDMLKIESVIEIRDLLSRFTTDVIGTCAFGIECNSLKDPNAIFRKNGKKVFDDQKVTHFQRLLMTQFQNIARFLRLTVHHKDVEEFFLNIVKETVEYRETNNVHRNDFMNLLIQLKNDGFLKGDAEDKSDRLTINEIAAQAFVFFLAGFETSSTTLTFCLYELAQAENKSIQDQARAEINDILKKHNGELTYEAISEMVYCEQIINEALRKYPPAPGVGRVVTKEYKVPNTDVIFPVGMRLIIPVYGIHHDPDIYEQPEVFNPNRFSAEEVKKRPPCSFLAFGDGPRNCIGLRFGMMQARIGLVTLLKNFEFSTCHRTDPMPVEFSPTKFLLTPPNGVWLKIKAV